MSFLSGKDAEMAGQYFLAAIVMLRPQMKKNGRLANLMSLLLKTGNYTGAALVTRKEALRLHFGQ